MEKAAVFVFVIVAVVFPTASADYCSSYCDLNGYYNQGFYCNTDLDPYCCGTQNARSCCGNSTEDIGGKYPDVYVCERSSWWIYHWQVIIGLLGCIIVCLLLAACCCQCCAVCKQSATQASLTRRTSVSLRDRLSRVSFSNRRSSRIGADGGVATVAGDTNLHTFDPDVPFAFEPPSYESLPKDPPKYDELYVEGETNTAFMGDNTEDSGPSTSGGSSSAQTQDSQSQRDRNSTSSAHGNDVEDPLPSYEIAITRDRICPEVNTGTGSDDPAPSYEQEASNGRDERQRNQGESSAQVEVNQRSS